MLQRDSISYLKDAGFDYKPAESPDLWQHLESYFVGANRVGPKFNRLPASHVAELIQKGEAALLDAMVAAHQRTGKLQEVNETIDLPYIVGTEGRVPLASVDASQLLRLVEQPGTAKERIIHLVQVEADAMPCTRQMTVMGGLYGDGRTAGFFSLSPGRQNRGKKAKDDMAYLATAEDIRDLARDMEHKVDDIALVTRKECDEMLKRVKKVLVG